jgi:hypothetical protein
MEDYKKRSKLLKTLYDRRKEGRIRFTSVDLGLDLDCDEINRIAGQLQQYDLIQWDTTIDESGSIIISEGAITAKGVDVIEQGGAKHPLKIVIDNSVNISDSSNIQIGDNNELNNLTLNDLIVGIENSTLSEKEKHDLEERLNSIIKHPLVLLALRSLGRIIGI